jgi:hypothetical protein
MYYPKITIERTINRISLFDNEVLTVYLHPHMDRYAGIHPNEHTQLEIRITKKGNIELFCDDKNIEIKPFDKWYDEDNK